MIVYNKAYSKSKGIIDIMKLIQFFITIEHISHMQITW